MKTVKFEIELDITSDVDYKGPNEITEDQLMEIGRNLDESIRIHENEYGVTPYPLDLKLIRVKSIT